MKVRRKSVLVAIVASLAIVTGFGVLAAITVPPLVQANVSGLRTELVVVEGTIGEFATNSMVEIDGWNLIDEQKIHFQPHFGKVIAEKIPAGSTVRILGFNETFPDGTTGLEAWAVESGGSAFAVTPPLTKGPKHEPMDARGTIASLGTNRGGEVDGCTLSDGTLVKFPFHFSAKFQELFQVGDAIEVHGDWRGRRSCLER